MITLNSSQLGERAKDGNSFSQLFLSFAASKGSIRVNDIRLLNVDSKKKCEITGGFNSNAMWDLEWWPLGVSPPKELKPYMRRVTALLQYIALHSDYVDLEPGDEVQVLNRDDRGYTRVRKKDGREGKVPTQCLDLVLLDDPWRKFEKDPWTPEEKMPNKYYS